MQNSAPGFTRQANVGSVTVTAANTKSDGSGTVGTDTFLAFTADATNGSFVDYVRWIPTGTTAATTTAATTARVYLSSVGTGTVSSANTFLIAEVALPAVSADNSTAANNPIDVPIQMRIPTGWFLLVQTHVAPTAATAWRATAVGGDY